MTQRPQQMMVGDKDLDWTPLRDESEKVIGRIGVLPDMHLGRLRHVDGWRSAIALAPIDIPPDRLPPEFAGRYPSVTCVLLDIPDYASEDGITLVITSGDALRLAAELSRAAREIQREAARVKRDDARRENSWRELVGASDLSHHCAEGGCDRDRHFFDADGVGYCKRHGAARGLRPSGKVT